MKNFIIYISLFAVFTLNAQLFKALSPEKSGIDFENKLVETPDENIITYEYFYNGAGVAAGDFNNDGLIDLFFISNQGKNKLYINKGKLEFQDISESAGIECEDGWKTGVNLVDINQDGFLDLYISFSGNVSRDKRKNKLFINQGNLTFKEEAEKYGIDDEGYSTQSAFFDFDKDGDLDLFVLNHNTKQFRNFNSAYLKSQIDRDAGDRLYENQRGKFQDITEEARILSNPIGYGLGIVIEDFNQDHWPDIYVTNDYVEEDYLYLNNHNGTFTNVLKSQFPQISYFSMGVDSGDINNDGLMDIITLDMLPEDNKRQKLIYAPDNFEVYDNMVMNGFHHQSMRNMLQLNNGNGTYSEIGQLAGVSNTDWSWSPLIADFNNDGLNDIYITNGYRRDMINRDFMKFYVDERMKYLEGKSDNSMFTILQEVVSTPLQNYLFINNGNYHFENKTLEYGLEGKDFSHGATYADLDNDGDLEIIVNCMNETAKIFENKSNEVYKSNDFIEVKLQPMAIGSRVTLFSGKEKLVRSLQTTHGFESSNFIPLHFGLGNKKIDSVQVIWPDLRSEIFKNIPVNRSIEIIKASGTPSGISTEEKLFKIKTDTLNYSHDELLVNDFKVQPLMPYMISFHGPKIKKIDINEDGLEDLFIGGPEGKAPELLIQDENGKFSSSVQPAFINSANYEDTNATFFDADGDGDLDLYVVSGGYGEIDSGLPLEDRLYINQNGTFEISNDLPTDSYAGSCAVPWDYDEDGDIDLFVGSRVKQGAFPMAPPSLLLTNNSKGKFTSTRAAFLENLGMVTDAKIADLNGDGNIELIITGDWNHPKIFGYRNHKFEELTDNFFNEKYNGWWNCVEINDLDNDGDLDIIIGNWGLNNQFKPTKKEPMELFYDDFDSNGFIDPIWCYYIQGKSYPALSKDELTDQIIGLRKKYVKYETFSNQTLEEVFEDKDLDKSPKLTTDFMETIWFENVNGHFELRHFPVEANFSSTFAILVEDFDQDGIKDVLLGGNTEFNRVRTGRSHASFGTFLKGKRDKTFDYIPQSKTGISFTGAIRSLNWLNDSRILVGINNSKPLIIQLN